LADGIEGRVKTIAVYLGANRSLTTISAAMLALHPDVTVLNHAFTRIFADPANDFLVEPTPEKLASFATAACEMALGGERGAVGGHILHSHAFGEATLRQTYLDRYGWDAKPQSTCLLWKDATRVTNYLINNRIALDAVARSLPALRFVIMVRNPVDICISSIRKGYSERLVGAEHKNSLKHVFTHMIKLFAWFSKAAAANPAQFRFIYQDELIDRARLIELCRFLDISADENWLDDIARLIRLRPSYPITEEQKAHFKALTHQMIADDFIASRVADQIV